ERAFPQAQAFLGKNCQSAGWKKKVVRGVLFWLRSINHFMNRSLRPRPSRRHFLQTAVTAAAAPFILPSRVWSADTAPNDRLNLGFIGMGKMNSGHLGNF